MSRFLMSLFGLFLLFALAVRVSARPQQDWEAKITLKAVLPDGVQAPITVEAKEPAGASVKFQPNWAGNYYVVSSRSKFSHVLLVIKAYGFEDEVISGPPLSWDLNQSYQDLSVKFREGTLPIFRSVEVVKAGESSSKGFNVAVFNPYERELLITNLDVSGNRSLPIGVAQGQLTSAVFELSLTVAGNQVTGTAKEKGKIIQRDIKGTYLDGGTSVGLGFTFNPEVPVKMKENSTITIFPKITGSKLLDRGRGTSRPLMTPHPESLWDMTTLTFTVEFDHELKITKKCQINAQGLECR